MSDLLAPPAIALRRRSTLETLALDPARELGAGGEARVLAVPGDDSLVAKLHHEPTLAKARKVALMMEEPPELDARAARLAWPCDLLFDGGGAFAGFLMPRVEGPRVFELYNPVTRRRTVPHADYAFLLRVAANVAAAFEALHARGYVIGDVNESNLLVGDDASVTLVDTDSMQVRDPADGAVHRSRVGKAEFTPPELQGRAFADFDRSPEHDRFGLAVLLFLLLMEGTHPFAGRLDDGGEMPPIEERIRRGLFPHDDHAEIRPPRLAPDISMLAAGLRALFVRCFEDGHADPAARPTAAEWRAALAEAEAKLVACDVNPRHRHGRHLGSCPWCARMAVLRVPDPFPADADAAPGKPARIPAPRVAPPAPTPSASANPPAGPAPKSAAPAPAPSPAPTPGAVPRPIAPSTPVPAATSAIPPAASATPTPQPKRKPAAPTRSTAPAPKPAAPVPAAAQQPASAGSSASPAAYHLPGGGDWLRQAMGPTGALHPGAWLAPVLVLALGPASLLPFSLLPIPVVLVALLTHRWSGPKEERLLGTFAVPSTVLLVLALWLTSALGGSWLLARGEDETPPPYETVIPAGTAKVQLGEPRAFLPGSDPPILRNHAAILFRLRERYPSSRDSRAHTLRLIVHVRADGTVDPEKTQIADSTDPVLAKVVEEVAPEMVFVPPVAGGEVTPGWVRVDVTYGA